jgi:hypothetical protein
MMSQADKGGQTEIDFLRTKFEILELTKVQSVASLRTVNFNSSFYRVDQVSGVSIAVSTLAVSCSISTAVKYINSRQKQ